MLASTNDMEILIVIVITINIHITIIATHVEMVELSTVVVFHLVVHVLLTVYFLLSKNVIPMERLR